MAQHDGETAAAGSAIEKKATRDVSVGTAVISPNALENPGLPPHQPRVTDLDPKKEKAAQRRVIWLFTLSMIGSIFAIYAYIAFPIEAGNLVSTRLNNLLVGLGIAVALIPIGIGAIYWAKNLMKNDELVEARHGTRGTEETRAAAAEVFRVGNEESGFGRRKLLRNIYRGVESLTAL
ncbi:MAG TPA: ubiquinol-cytochrome C reductase, partial [Terrimesophilobacter sp.]|nr:ubiquinol-cytochrome C reductase [Terrimesophilobacter sp.]